MKQKKRVLHRNETPVLFIKLLSGFVFPDSSGHDDHPNDDPDP